MSIICRKATLEDIHDVSELFQEDWCTIPEFSKRQEHIYQRILQEDMTELLVIEKDQYVVGVCHYASIPMLAGGGRYSAVLSHFVVDPIKRRQGLAKQLMEYALQYSKKQGCFQILVMLDELTPWQVETLKSYGFTHNSNMLVLS